MEAIAISNGYMAGKVYVVWEVPHDNITGYEIYRDDICIASSLIEEGDKFVAPTIFDHDHQTNLFKKDSHFKLMFVDEKVSRYQEYKYQIVASRLSDGTLVESIKSNPIYVTAQ